MGFWRLAKAGRPLVCIRRPMRRRRPGRAKEVQASPAPGCGPVAGKAWRGTGPRALSFSVWLWLSASWLMRPRAFSHRPWARWALLPGPKPVLKRTRTGKRRRINRRETFMGHAPGSGEEKPNFARILGSLGFSRATCSSWRYGKEPVARGDHNKRVSTSQKRLPRRRRSC